VTSDFTCDATEEVNIPALAFIQSTVTGALNKLSFALNFLRASVVPVASVMTLPAWSKVFKDAGQLVGSGSGLLYVYIRHASVVILPTNLQSISRVVLPHTQSEICPLQLALLGVVSCLVDGSSLCCVCRGLLQEGVGADRGWRGSLVEERDDILLSGLI
jgi:hypothetical protein